MKKKHDWDEDDYRYHPQYGIKEKDFYSQVAKKKHEERIDKYKYKSEQWAVKSKAISKEQVLELFWNKLVEYGWKLHTNKDIELLVLPCPTCNQIVHQVIIKNFTQPNEITASYFASKVIDRHRSETNCRREERPEGFPDVAV